MDLIASCLSEIMGLTGVTVYAGQACTEDYQQYLKREERILSLARKAQKRKSEERTAFSFLTEKKASSDMDMMELASHVGKMAIKSVRDRLVFRNDGSYDISALTEMVLPELMEHFSFTSTDDYMERLARGVYKDRGIYAISFRIKGDDREWLSCVDKVLNRRKLYYGYALRHSIRYGYFFDAAVLFGWLIVLSEVILYLRGHEDIEDPVRSMFLEYEKRNANDIVERKIPISRDNDRLFGDYLRQYGSVTVSDGRGIGGYEALPLFFVQNGWHSPLDCNVKNYLYRLFARAFCRIKLDAGARARQERHYRRESAESATVYMTKKNIPQKTVREMENSVLNTHFGYVEFDEEVDLELVKEFEKDFFALVGFLGEGPKTGYQIRLRKLGRHHASGLYFPYLRCMCVDLRVPGSTAHEYMHLLDEHYKELSMKAPFDAVKEKYISLLKKHEKEIAEKCGKSKYNMEYYCMPTEIFARCGEMYLVRTAGMCNSLANPDMESFAYPEDDELMELINAYFKAFLERDKEEKDDND